MKDRTTAILLALLLGGVGVHKFYLDRPGAGVAYLLFCWTLIPSLLGLIDGLSLAFMSNEAFDAQYNFRYQLPNPAQAAPQQIAQSVVVEAPPVSVADELRKLRELVDEGVLTEAEFQDQKRRLLEQS